MGTTSPTSPDRLSAACLRTLRDWCPPDAAQQQLRDDFVSWLGSRPNAWSRACGHAHVTASSLVCHPGRSAVLLVLRAPFLVVVIGAAAVAAGLRALGWG